MKSVEIGRKRQTRNTSVHCRRYALARAPCVSVTFGRVAGHFENVGLWDFMRSELWMKQPDFFIIGAPKCGTTTLYRWLRRHPDVYMPALKEPHYHSLDLPGLRVIDTSEEYSELFATAPPGFRLGEASASYLQSDVAVERILEKTPEAKFVAILRNPVEMAHAMHGEKLANLSEDVGDFEKAWRLQSLRAAGGQLPPRTREPQTLQYREVCALGTQIEKFMTRVPIEQRLILLTDDLRAAPLNVYAQLLQFLGLRHVVLTEVAPENASHSLRSRKLAEFHRDLPRILGPFYNPAKKLGNSIGLSPSVILARINTQRMSRPKLSSDFDSELREVFVGEIIKLERLLGRDLSHWRKGDNA